MLIEKPIDEKTLDSFDTGTKIHLLLDFFSLKKKVVLDPIVSKNINAILLAWKDDPDNWVREIVSTLSWFQKNFYSETNSKESDEIKALNLERTDEIRIKPLIDNIISCGNEYCQSLDLSSTTSTKPNPNSIFFLAKPLFVKLNENILNDKGGSTSNQAGVSTPNPDNAIPTTPNSELKKSQSIPPPMLKKHAHFCLKNNATVHFDFFKPFRPFHPKMPSPMAPKPQQKLELRKKVVLNALNNQQNTPNNESSGQILDSPKSKKLEINTSPQIQIQSFPSESSQEIQTNEQNEDSLPSPASATDVSNDKKGLKRPAFSEDQQSGGNASPSTTQPPTKKRKLGTSTSNSKFLKQSPDCASSFPTSSAFPSASLAREELHVREELYVRKSHDDFLEQLLKPQKSHTETRTLEIGTEIPNLITQDLLNPKSNRSKMSEEEKERKKKEKVEQKQKKELEKEEKKKQKEEAKQKKLQEIEQKKQQKKQEKEEKEKAAKIEKQKRLQIEKEQREREQREKEQLEREQKERELREQREQQREVVVPQNQHLPNLNKPNLVSPFATHFNQPAPMNPMNPMNFGMNTLNPFISQGISPQFMNFQNFFNPNQQQQQMRNVQNVQNMQNQEQKMNNPMITTKLLNPPVQNMQKPQNIFTNIFNSPQNNNNPNQIINKFPTLPSFESISSNNPPKLNNNNPNPNFMNQSPIPKPANFPFQSIFPTSIFGNQQQQQNPQLQQQQQIPQPQLQQQQQKANLPPFQFPANLPHFDPQFLQQQLKQFAKQNPLYLNNLPNAQQQQQQQNKPQ